jgi:hypothetical protein
VLKSVVLILRGSVFKKTKLARWDTLSNGGNLGTIEIVIGDKLSTSALTSC